MPAMPNPSTGSQDSAFDEFLAAERAQESGGDYGVVNSIGAAGAYQVMSYHIPDWSKAALGHSETLSQFLHSPADQDAIARFEFKPVYDKYGPRGAAAWWYSGDASLANDYRPQKNGPSIGAYVDQVLGRIGKAGSVTGGSSGGTASQADDTSGSGPRQTAFEQAGYAVPVDTDLFGIPINPLKIPEWLLKNTPGGGGGGSTDGMFSAISSSISSLLLTGLFVAGGVGVVLIGVSVMAKPELDKAKDTVINLTGDAAQVAPLAAL